VNSESHPSVGLVTLQLKSDVTVTPTPTRGVTMSIAATSRWSTVAGLLEHADVSAIAEASTHVAPGLRHRVITP
jgi:hypothetical protein